MADSSDRESCLVWSWIIEYIASFPQINISLLHEIVMLAPKLPEDLSKNVTEIVSLRCLEELSGPCDRQTMDVDFSQNPDASIDLSALCFDVLSSVVSEMPLSEPLKRDVRFFIRHKRDSMPKCALEKLKEGILSGVDLCAVSGPTGRVCAHDKHDQNTMDTGRCNGLARCCGSSSHDQTKVLQFVGELGKRNFSPCKRNKGEWASMASAKDYLGIQDCVDGGDQVHGSSKRYKPDSVCANQSTEQISFDHHGKESIENSSEGVIGLSEKEDCHVEGAKVLDTETNLPLESGNQESVATERLCLGSETPAEEFQLSKDVTCHPWDKTEVQEITSDSNPLENCGLLDKTNFPSVKNLVCEKNLAGDSHEIPINMGFAKNSDGMVESSKENSLCASQAAGLNSSNLYGKELTEDSCILNRVSVGNAEDSSNAGDQLMTQKAKTPNRQFFVDDLENSKEDGTILNQKKHNGTDDSVALSLRTELKLCAKCNSDAQFLDASNSSSILHEKCLGFLVKYYKQENSCCPCCAHSFAISKYLEAKKCASLARKELTAFTRMNLSYQQRELDDILRRKNDSNSRRKRGNNLLFKIHEKANLEMSGCNQANRVTSSNHHVQDVKGNKQLVKPKALYTQGRQEEPDVTRRKTEVAIHSTSGLDTNIQTCLDNQHKEHNDSLCRKNERNLRRNRGNRYRPEVQENEYLENIGCDQANTKVVRDYHKLIRNGDKQPLEPEALSKRGRRKEPDVPSKKAEVISPQGGLGTNAKKGLEDQQKERNGRLHRKKDGKSKNYGSKNIWSHRKNGSNSRSNRIKNFSPEGQENVNFDNISQNQTNGGIINDHHVLSRKGDKQLLETEALCTKDRQEEPSITGRQVVLGLGSVVCIGFSEQQKELNGSFRKNDSNSKSNRDNNLSPKEQESANLQKVGCNEANSGVISNQVLDRKSDKQLVEPEAPCSQARQEETDITCMKAEAVVSFVRGLGTVDMEERQVNVDSKLNNDTLICKSKEVASVTGGKGVRGMQKELIQLDLNQPVSEASEEYLNAVNTGKEDSSTGESDECIISNYSIRVRTKERRYKCAFNPQILRRKTIPWTMDEEDKLREAVGKFSSNSKNCSSIPWKVILEYGRSTFQRGRTIMDLKDKWRNMCK